MMSTEVVNNALALPNLIATIVSIGLTIASFVFARKAKGYKEEVQKAYERIDISSLTKEFEIVSRKFLKDTAEKDWHKGLSSYGIILSSMDDVLLKIPKVYYLFDTKKGDSGQSEVDLLKQNIMIIQNNLVGYEDAGQIKIKQTKKSIHNITELLNMKSTELIK